jgi:DNA-binding response OmpR family regulator
MKILIIEDEADIASFLKKNLEENGHEVSLAFDGELGFRIAENANFDLILLDIIIPKINGLDLCTMLRDRLNYKGIIIMLTALGTTDDIVSGLNKGADDYLVKPIKLKELNARINAHSRKRSNNRSIELKANDLRLNIDRKQVHRGETEINLTAKEFNLLEYLLRNKNRVLSRAQILENVWEVNFDMGTNIVDVYINYLRSKIDKSFDEKLIHTVVGMGYVLKAED